MMLQGVMGQTLTNQFNLNNPNERRINMLGYDGIKNGHNLHNLNRVISYINQNHHHEYLNLSKSILNGKKCDYRPYFTTKCRDYVDSMYTNYYSNINNSVLSNDECSENHNGYLLSYLYCLINLFLNHESSYLLNSIYPLDTGKRIKEINKIPNKNPVNNLDLNIFPPEISLNVLSNLNATDLCLAGCVWRSLGNDDSLWMNLCKTNWVYCEIYQKYHESSLTTTNEPFPPMTSFKHLYMKLDEGTLTFNANYLMGIEYFIKHSIVYDSSQSIASFLYGTYKLDRTNLGLYLNERRDILEIYMGLHKFDKIFLPVALRYLFIKIKPPNVDNFLQIILETFSKIYTKCNPSLNFYPDQIFLLCFSMIMLSVDLCSPHVKNKMSKREFIKNIRHAITGLNDDELVGSLYDDVYTRGHIAPKGEIF